jgi:iron complex outermembrane receptor protein
LAKARGARPGRRLQALFAASVSCATLLAGAARAEGGAEHENPGERRLLDGIVVTGVRAKEASAGTKTSTPLISTPQSVTVIDNAELVRRNALSINQALGYVAGVAANQRGGMVTRYDQLILRGFTPGVYLDGMRLLAGPYSMPQIDFNRIDHVDVVKGPASVLYGNSTPGGLVNLTSKTPEETASGRLEGQLGDYAYRRVAADVNQPLSADGRWLSRVVGGWQKGDGFTKGTFSERWHVSGMVSFIPSPDTTITVIAAYQHSPDGGGYSGVPAYGSVLPSPYGKLPEDINTGDLTYERYNHKAKSVAAFLRHDFNEHLTLRSSFRFQNNRLSYRQLYVAGYPTIGAGADRNTDFSTIIRGGGGADEDFDTLTLDNNFNARFSTGALQHNVLAGVDYQKITGENVQQFNTGVSANPLTSIPNLSLIAPVYGGVMPSSDLRVLSSAYVNTYTKRDQTGVYIQDQVSLGQLRLIASGRQDWYKQHTLNKRNNTRTILDQNAFTMRLGALYELKSGLSPFVSYSESFEPQAGTTWQGTPFVPVTGRQYEGGLKYRPPGTQAIFTLAAYDLRRQKVPVSDPAAGTNGVPPTSTIQIGEVRVRGVELEGRGEVVPGLNVVATASYTDAIITKGAPAVAPTATSNGTPSTTGTRQLGTPKWAASGFVSYDFDRSERFAGPLAGLTLGAGLRYVGGSDGATNYAVIDNVTTYQRFRTKGFVLVDALVGYDLAKASPRLEGLNLALNVANLLDERHVTACPFQNSCYFGASRTVIGSIRYAW